MSFPVFLHPTVVKYLDSLSPKERERCYNGLKNLSSDPYTPRPECDIKKMSGKKDFYRLRVGSHRFLYIVRESEVLVEEGLKRETGY
jgi:mRNA-degrading endonuclease RelE of RelBE toxin-antitoxin system